MSKSRSIIISGGGIAGLTAALCLARNGFRVEVFEKAPRFDPVGAGIQLSPNALFILDALGLGRELRRVATAPVGINVYGAYRARKIQTIPLGAKAIERFGLPYLTIHRGDLHSILTSTCEMEADIALHMGSEVTDVTEHANGISILVQSSNGLITRKGFCFIAADGVHSRFRNDLFEVAGPVHSGFEAWRGLIPVEKLDPAFNPDATSLILGRGSHGIFYSVRAGRTVNVLIAIRSREKTLIPQKNIDPSPLRSATSWWHKRLRTCFDQVENWATWPLLTAGKLRHWNEGACVLIGDAAHAMLPYAAQGAAMAIEDAFELATLLKPDNDPTSAFKSFAARRRKRVAKVAKLAETNGQLYHMGWPFSAVRNIGMRLIPGSQLLNRQAWIYGWRPEGQFADTNETQSG